MEEFDLYRMIQEIIDEKSIGFGGIAMIKRIVSMALAMVLMMSIIPWQAKSVEANSVFLPLWPVDARHVRCLDRYSGLSHHRGIDIAADFGSEVRSVANGTVVKVNNSCSHVSVEGDQCGDSWGNYIIIQHVVNGTVYHSLYAHLKLDSIVVKEGDTVSAGQKIALSGSSGNSSGAHLHLELFQGERTREKARQSFQYYVNNPAVIDGVSFEKHVASSSEFYGQWVRENCTLTGERYIYSYSGTPAGCSCSEAYAGWYQVTLNDSLYIRSGHGASTEKLGEMPAGEVIYISKATGTGTGNWGHVTYNGISGYCAMGLLSVYQGADIGTDFYAPIFNKEHWKIIENSNGVVQTADEMGSANQLWKFERQSDGSYKISSCLDGRCLDVANASNAAGAKVWVVDSNNTDAQRWYIYEEAGGYILKAKCTDCVLDMPNNDPTNGNQLNMYTKNGTGAQVWAIYRGEECQLKGTTLTVDAGTTLSGTMFSWDDVYGESHYDVKIWKDTCWDGEPDYVGWSVASGWEIQLPAGTYQAYVDALNYFDCKMSNVVTFTVEAGYDSKPNYAEVYLTHNNFQVGETIVFNFLSDAGTGYTIGIDDQNGNRIDTYDTKSNTYERTFEYTGNYSCYVTAYNEYGIVDSERIYFNVYDSKPQFVSVITNKPKYEIEEEIIFSFSSDTGNAYTIGIDDESGARILTYDTREHVYVWQCYNPGKYSCYITTYNNYGLLDSERIYFEVTKKCENGHTYACSVATSPTITLPGTLVGSCSVCLETVTISIPALNKTDYAYKATKAATCTETGIGKYTWETTTYGSFYFEVTIPETGHIYTSVRTSPTCTEQGYTTHTCGDCGVSYRGGYADALGHSYTSVVTAPTCTEQGYTTYTCDICTDRYIDSYVDAPGHSWSAWKVVKPASADTEGEQQRNCGECSATESKIIPKLEAPKSDAKIIVSSKSAVIGQRVEITISLENNPGFASMQLTVGYDTDVMTLVSVTDAGKLGSAVHSDNLVACPYTLTWANDLATENYTYNGEIVTLVFQVAEDAQPGDYAVTVSYDYDNFEIFNVDGEEVLFATVNGSVNVVDVMLGDVNSDGKVNTQDRMILTRYLAKWTGYTENTINLTAADVNCDGKVNTQDRMILTRYLAKWTGYEDLGG